MLLDRWLAIDIRIRRITVLVISIILLLGTALVGFMILEELSFFDSLWMTIISVMTIGYGDIYPRTEEGRWFALLLVPIGAGIVTYGLGLGATYLIEKQLVEKVWGKKMEHDIDKLEGHIIVCGFGRVARQVYKQLKEDEEDVQVLYIHDKEEELLELVDAGTLRIIGHPTDKEVLKKARVDKARALVTALGNDADNVFITLMAKGMNEQLEIAARAEKEESEEILKKAGASRVINPSVIGGRELAMSILKPTGTEYINHLIRSEKKAFTVEEVLLDERSPILGLTIEEADISDQYGVALVAIMRKKRFISNPERDERFELEDTLIVIGDPKDVEALRNSSNGNAELNKNKRDTRQ